MSYSIGELAGRTGVPVKTIRHWSDLGLVPPSGRTAAGYRRYDAGAAARLDLVRTLRDLGLDLATVRAVADRERSLSEVAAAHAEALATQIRVLRLRQAVLTLVARRGSGPAETEQLHRLARLTEAGRDALIGEFLDAAFGGLDDPVFDGIARSLTPELPADPTPDQITAWVELAELARDPEFRLVVRRMAEVFAAARIPGELPHRAESETADHRDPRWEQYQTLAGIINGWG
jgi:DNA-binding transcriptional MerR regulator